MYSDIIEILMDAPSNFTIQDAFTKCNSMINSRQHQHILCALPISYEGIVINDIVSKCDFEHKVDYQVNPTVEAYDLVIGDERLSTTTSFTECAGDGLYRPVFWFEDSDLEEYINYYHDERKTHSFSYGDISDKSQ